MKIVKLPSPMRLLCGSMLAYWLAGIINPGFVAIAVMIVLFIPLFMSDYFSGHSEVSYQSEQSNYSVHRPSNNIGSKGSDTSNKSSSIKLLMEENQAAKKD